MSGKLDEGQESSAPSARRLPTGVERLRRMLEIRLFEDRVLGLFGEGLIHGTTHTCQGQEAVAVGVAAAIADSDSVTATYRGHGIALALGMDPYVAMCEILGRRDGCMGGLGGSMHLSDLDHGLLPTFSIVGAGIPIAAGMALASVVSESKSVCVSLFGDGATNIGAFHESLNLAAVWKLPVVFICENNLYGEYSPIGRTTGIVDIAARADSYGIEGHSVDGQDVDAVMSATAEAVNFAREGNGPTLIEAKTYRYAGHSRGDTGSYRPSGELEVWKARDPIKSLERKLLASGEITGEEVDALSGEVELLLETVVERAIACPEPRLDAMFENIWSAPPLSVDP